MGFNLLTDPWIPAATTRRPGLAEYSLLDLLTHAHALQRIECQHPTVEAAVTRLLLAVLHTSVEGPATAAEWGRLWKAGRLPAEQAAAYLTPLRDRFDLDVFAQTPGLDVADHGIDKVTAYADRGAAAGWFNPIPRELSPAQAARWLLWCHAYDGGGIRSKHGGGRHPGCPAGPLAYRTHTLVHGLTLAETLLLNLTLYSCPTGDLAWWERIDGLDRATDPGPGGLVRRLTWPGRRILLQRDGDVYRQVRIAAGDDARGGIDDPYASAPWTDPNESLTFAQASPRRLAALAGQNVIAPKGSSGDHRYAAPALQPGVLAHLAQMVDGGHLPPETLVSVAVAGIRYDKYMTVIHDETELRTPLLPAETFTPGRAANGGWGRLWAAQDAYERQVRDAARVAAQTRTSDRQQVDAAGGNAVVQLRHAANSATHHALSRLEEPAELDEWQAEMRTIVDALLEEAENEAIRSWR